MAHPTQTLHHNQNINKQKAKPKPQLSTDLILQIINIAVDDALDDTLSAPERTVFRTHKTCAQAISALARTSELILRHIYVTIQCRHRTIEPVLKQSLKDFSEHQLACDMDQWDQVFAGLPLTKCEECERLQTDNEGMALAQSLNESLEREVWWLGCSMGLSPLRDGAYYDMLISLEDAAKAVAAMRRMGRAGWLGQTRSPVSPTPDRFFWCG